MNYYQLTYDFNDGSGWRKELVKSKIVLRNLKQAEKIFPSTSICPAHLVNVRIISWYDYFFGKTY